MVVDDLDDTCADMRSAGCVPSIEGGGVRVRFTDGSNVVASTYSDGAWRADDVVLRAGDIVLLHAQGYLCVVRQ